MPPPIYPWGIEEQTWMAVERGRGISVSSPVMSFEHEGLAFNPLDTPATRISAQEDFSERTYRTLTAVDSAVTTTRGAVLN